MREPELKELQGASKLARGFFNRLIRRIECTKPIAGTNVSIVQQDDGFKITADATPYPSVTFSVISLQVCSGGDTETVYVLSVPSSNPDLFELLKKQD